MEQILKVSRTDAGTVLMMNQLQKTFSIVLFKALKGKMYFVLFHHRFLRYNLAPHLLIGTTHKKDGYYYYYTIPVKQKIQHFIPIDNDRFN